MRQQDISSDRPGLVGNPEAHPCRAPGIQAQNSDLQLRDPAYSRNLQNAAEQSPSSVQSPFGNRIQPESIRRLMTVLNHCVPNRARDAGPMVWTLQQVRLA